MSSARLVLACLLSLLAGVSAAQAEPPSEPRVVVVLEPNLAAARAAGKSEPELLAQLDRALLKRAEGAPLVRAARVEPRGERREVVLELAGEMDAAALEELADLLSTRGVLDITVVAAQEDGLELPAEEERLKRWLDAHPDAPLSAFSALAREKGGPDPRLRWAEHSFQGLTQPLSRFDRRLPLLVASDPARRFGTEDLARTYPSTDPSGFPALGFELAKARRRDFGDFTEAYVERSMAILIDDQVVTVATINERLPGSGIILGRFSSKEVERMIRVLSTAAPLPVPVRVVEVRRS